MNIVAVIPARGGSKGIPRKNMRLMNGKPLIAYSIENAIASKMIDTVIVSSDSDEILSFSSQYENVMPLNRESSLAQDTVTLDPVIYDAVVRAENEQGVTFDYVVTMQPTSPLLKVETLDAAICALLNSDFDSSISVVNAPHLSWRKSESGEIVPRYEQRLNRQQLPPNFLETGAFVISRRCCVTQESRLGNAVSVFEIPEDESIDIDNKQDWVVCEALLNRKTILFRVDGHKELGLGHIYRALTLAYMLTEHEVLFVCDARHRLGINKLRETNMRVYEVQDDLELFDVIEQIKPDIFVNDRLDSDFEFIKKVKSLVKRVVTFEDLGDGARVADAVVNALYEGSSPHTNEYLGKRYAALRDEFLTSTPKPFSDEVNRVLVMFGGTDPQDLSYRLFLIAKEHNRNDVSVRFDFILGPGYEGRVTCSEPDSGIEVIRDAVRVSDYMKHADLAFSSQGRTTFELASMGIPTIVLAQNKREQLHRFAQMDNGFINLGLGSEVSDEDIQAAFDWLLKAKSVRKEMHRLMLDNDLKSGVIRVKRIILGE